MAATPFDRLTPEQRLRLSLDQDVRALCQESAQVLNLEFHQNSLALIGELAWRRLQVYATDLEQFAKHAKRSNINIEDVKLLVRRNHALKSRITHLAENLPTSAAVKKRKATVANGDTASSSNNKTKAGDSKKAKNDSTENVDTTIDLT